MQATSRALAPSAADRAAIHSHALAAQFDEDFAYDDEFDDSFEEGPVRGADLAGECEGDAVLCLCLCLCHLECLGLQQDAMTRLHPLGDKEAGAVIALRRWGERCPAGGATRSCAPAQAASAEWTQSTEQQQALGARRQVLPVSCWSLHWPALPDAPLHSCLQPAGTRSTQLALACKLRPLSSVSHLC